MLWRDDDTTVGTWHRNTPWTVSFMQDVYSFGVLLLEIVSGRKNHRGFNLIAYVSIDHPFQKLDI